MLHRRSLLLRRRRALTRAHRHRLASRRSARQPALQPRPPHHAGRHRFRLASRPGSRRPTPPALADLSQGRRPMTKLLFLVLLFLFLVLFLLPLRSLGPCVLLLFSVPSVNSVLRDPF